MLEALSSPLTYNQAALLFALYASLGAGLVYAAYKGLEASPSMGGVVALFYSAAVVFATRWVAATQLVLTAKDAELALIAAALGAATGASLVVISFKPELPSLTGNPAE